jgi:hypothetical protein
VHFDPTLDARNARAAAVPKAILAVVGALEEQYVDRLIAAGRSGADPTSILRWLGEFDRIKMAVLAKPGTSPES